MKSRADVMLETVRKAGALALSMSAKELEVHSKAVNDFVTQADATLEALIRREVLSAFHEDGFFGEEGGVTASRDGFQWVVDPIDGTVNYMNGFPGWTVSVAVQRDGVTECAAVYNPFFDELYHATREDGARLNGRRISATRLPLEHTVALVVPPHRFHDLLDSFWDDERKIYPLVSDTRSIGSAALSCCQVAAGRAGLYYEWGLHQYDIAAGLFIAQMAGCLVNTRARQDDMTDVAVFSSAYSGILDGVFFK